MLKIAGKAGVAGVAPAEDDARGRKQKGDQAEAVYIARQLVDDEFRIRMQCAEVLKVLLGDAFDDGGIEKQRIGFEVGSLEASGDFEDGAGLSGRANAGMADGDLLDEGRTGSRHADDEDGDFRRIAQPRRCSKNSAENVSMIASTWRRADSRS